MHIRKEAVALVKHFNKYKNEALITNGEFLREVCNYFNKINDEELNKSDLDFLYYFSNKVGVPQYFDLLLKNKKMSYEYALSNLSLGSLISESNLHITEESKVHIHQKKLIEQFEVEKQNRLLFSAPTSFGKTYAVYEIIRKMAYKNIVLIFPTISLLTENYLKIIDYMENGVFKDYKLITLSDEIPSDSANIIIFTPERFMSFVDKNKGVMFDFIFIDEIYKIDNQFIEFDDDSVENVKDTARDVSFRIALEFACGLSNDILLTGPFLKFDPSGSLSAFLADNRFKYKDFNDIELVQKNIISVNNNEIDVNNQKIIFNSKVRKVQYRKLNLILEKLVDENTIVYCSNKYDTRRFTKKIIENSIYPDVNENEEFRDSELIKEYNEFLEHIESRFSSEWVLLKGLKVGVGIHNGSTPKYIQKEIIKYFNKGVIKAIISTTTITEGVNTSAKNIIIMSSMKGKKSLKKFDAKNIIGRAGRFSHHFSGRVFVVEDEFNDILGSIDDNISHINYDVNSVKDDVDIDITQDKYLNDSQKESKKEVDHQIKNLDIPLTIFDSFKGISRKLKIEIFKVISNFSNEQIEDIKTFIRLSNGGIFVVTGFDLIFNSIQPMVESENLKSLIITKVAGDSQLSILTWKVKSYIDEGFRGMLDYQIREKRKEHDTAISNILDFVYNTLKYEVVKYLGVFDLIYRAIISIRENKLLDDVVGFGNLLTFLEYGAYNADVKKISDYGVPFNVVKLFDNKNISLDEYEDKVYEKAKDDIINSNK